MTEDTPNGTTSDQPWPTGQQRARVPDTSMLPGSQTTSPAAVGMLRSATLGAHDTIDRLAEGAEPAVRKIGDSVAAAGQSLHAAAGQMRQTRDDWAEGVRGKVRASPLACIAAALVVVPAVGLVIWVLFNMAQVERDLRSFCGLDGIPFEV